MGEGSLKAGAVSLCGTIFVAAAPAETVGERLYLGINGGGTFVQDLTFKDDLGSGKLRFDPGFRLDVAGGYDFTDWLAGEIETGFTINIAKAISEDGFERNSLVMFQVPIMANLRYRVPVRCRLRPFIGAGAGGVYTSLENDSLFANDQTGHDFVFGYQAFAGVHYQLNPKLEMGLQYKFMGTGQHHFENLGQTMTHAVSVSFALRF